MCYFCRMDKIVNIPTVRDYDEYWGLESRHPLVNVLEGSQVTHPIPNCRKLCSDKSVSEIAYSLGYQYPQYFSRAFKKAVGCTPNEYRNQPAAC